MRSWANLSLVSFSLVVACGGEIDGRRGVSDGGDRGTDASRGAGASDAGAPARDSAPAPMPDAGAMPAFDGPQLFVATTGDDDNPGTAELPFRTIQRGIDAATPGVTVRVAAGVYEEEIHGRTSGTEGARIRVVSEVRWGAIVRPTGAGDSIWRNAGSYVDIQGFEIDGTESPDARIGIYAHGSHVVVRNNYVHHVHDRGECTSQGGAGIHGEGYYGDEDVDILANLIHDAGPPGCDFDHGVYHTGSGAIVNNVVFRASGCALHLWHDPRHIDMVNNTVFNSGSGVCLGAGDEYGTSDVAGDYIRVVNNIIYDNETGVWAGGTLGPNNRFENNLLFGNAIDWALGRGEPTGTVTADPMFVDYRADGGGEYRLRAGSPAIDRGASALAPDTDFDGAPRPHGAGVDIGAFEHR